MKKIALSILVFLVFSNILLASGSSFKIEQVLEPNGDSLVTYELDFSEFLELTSDSSYSYYFDPTIEPNEDFDLLDYAEYPDAEDEGVDVEFSGYYTEIQSGDPVAYLDITIDSGFELTDLEATVDSYAFVDTSAYSTSVDYSYYFDPTIEPNEDFDLLDYAEYPDAEEYGLEVTLSYEEFQSGDPTVYIDISIENNNEETLEEVRVEDVYSYVFVDVNVYDDGSTVSGGSTTTEWIDASSAYVEPGEYSVVYLITFEDQDGEEKTVKHVGSIEVIENTYDNYETSVKMYVDASSAYVEPGLYPVVYLITYTEGEEEKTVKHIEYLDIIENDYEEDYKESYFYKIQNFLSEMDDYCDDILETYPDSECNYSDGVLELSREITPEIGDYEFRKQFEFPYYSNYIIGLEKLPRLFEDEDDLPLSEFSIWNDFEDGLSEEELGYIGEYNIKIKYRVEMPGEILLAENGDSKSYFNVAKYDVLELFEDEDDILVKSQEVDLGLICGLGLIGLIFVVAVAAILNKAIKI